MIKVDKNKIWRGKYWHGIPTRWINVMKNSSRCNVKPHKECLIFISIQLLVCTKLSTKAWILLVPLPLHIVNKFNYFRYLKIYREGYLQEVWLMDDLLAHKMLLNKVSLKFVSELKVYLGSPVNIQATHALFSWTL